MITLGIVKSFCQLSERNERKQGNTYFLKALACRHKRFRAEEPETLQKTLAAK
jgi:hypothetical protein